MRVGFEMLRPELPSPSSIDTMRMEPGRRERLVVNEKGREFGEERRDGRRRGGHGMAVDWRRNAILGRFFFPPSESKL